MPRFCKPILDAEGRQIGIACGHTRSQKCSSCGRHGATQLCDYRLASGKTCDRPLCTRCAVSPKPVWGQTDRIDYCPAHARLVEAQKKAAP